MTTEGNSLSNSAAAHGIPDGHSSSPSSSDANSMEWASSSATSPEETTSLSPDTDGGEMDNDNQRKMSLDFVCQGLSAGLSSHSSESSTPTISPLEQLSLPSFDQLLSQLRSGSTQTSLTSPALSTMNDIPLYVPPNTRCSSPQASSSPRLLQKSTSPAEIQPRADWISHDDVQNGFDRSLALLMNDIRLYTPPNTRCSNTPAITTPQPRADRIPYDVEELYALLYFRSRCLEWSDIRNEFDVLFVENEPRRCFTLSGPVIERSVKAKGRSHPKLPPTYRSRTVGGLQCRYYRAIGEEFGKQKARGRVLLSSVLTTYGLRIIQAMDEKGMVSRSFSSDLAAIMRWYGWK